jgi:hypothetical protein
MAPHFEKVEEINPDDYKTVIKYAVFEDHDGKCHILTEKTKLPEHFGEKLDKSSIVFGCIGVAIHELVPKALEEAYEDIEATEAIMRKSKGKPQLKVINNDRPNESE